MSEENKWSVIKFVQELLLDEQDKSVITPALISQKIDLVLKIMPKKADGLDRDAVIEELIRRFSIWVGDEASLVDTEGHIPWLSIERKQNWRYWRRYRELQEKSFLGKQSRPSTEPPTVPSRCLKTLFEKAHGTGVGWWSGMYSQARLPTIQA